MALGQHFLRGLGHSLWVINIPLPRGILGNQGVIAQKQLPSGKERRTSRSEESFENMLQKLD